MTLKNAFPTSDFRYGTKRLTYVRITNKLEEQTTNVSIWKINYANNFISTGDKILKY